MATYLSNFTDEQKRQAISDGTALGSLNVPGLSGYTPPAPTVTTTPTTTPRVNRYDPNVLKGLNDQASFIKAELDKLALQETLQGQEGELDKAKRLRYLDEQGQADIARQAEESAARARQAQIDAINALYAPRYTEMEEGAKARDARARALALRTGQLGSGETPYQVASAKELSAKERQALDNEKAAKIQLAFGSFDAMKIKETERLTKLATETAENRIKYYQDQYDTALNAVKSLGEAGVTLEELKQNDPDAYNSLREIGGMSDFEINQQLQKASQTQYTQTTYDKDSGVLLAYGINPKTGKPEVYTQKVDLKQGEEYQEVGGVGYAVRRDANGNLTARPLTSRATKSTDSTGTSMSDADFLKELGL